MKTTMTVILVVALATGAPLPALAADGNGPETIRFKMGDLVLPFKHWGHQTALGGKCAGCHPDGAGRIAGWSKDTAHTLCISCHEKMQRGPTQCKQCHDVHYSQRN